VVACVYAGRRHTNERGGIAAAPIVLRKGAQNDAVYVARAFATAPRPGRQNAALARLPVPPSKPACPLFSTATLSSSQRTALVQSGLAATRRRFVLERNAPSHTNAVSVLARLLCSMHIHRSCPWIAPTRDSATPASTHSTRASARVNHPPRVDEDNRTRMCLPASSLLPSCAPHDQRTN